MPTLDPTWGPVFALMGVVATAFFGWLGVRRSSAPKVTDVAEEWRKMKEDVKKDLGEEIDRLKGVVADERQQRHEFEQRMTAQFDEVLRYFAAYVEWARAGAAPPTPHIPEWIFAKLADHFGGK